MKRGTPTLVVQKPGFKSRQGSNRSLMKPEWQVNGSMMSQRKTVEVNRRRPPGLNRALTSQQIGRLKPSRLLNMDACLTSTENKLPKQHRQELYEQVPECRFKKARIFLADQTIDWRCHGGWLGSPARR